MKSSTQSILIENDFLFTKKYISNKICINGFKNIAQNLSLLWLHLLLSLVLGKILKKMLVSSSGGNSTLKVKAFCFPSILCQGLSHWTSTTNPYPQSTSFNQSIEERGWKKWSATGACVLTELCIFCGFQTHESSQWHIYWSAQYCPQVLSSLMQIHSSYHFRQRFGETTGAA